MTTPFLIFLISISIADKNYMLKICNMLCILKHKSFQLNQRNVEGCSVLLHRVSEVCAQVWYEAEGEREAAGSLRTPATNVTLDDLLPGRNYTIYVRRSVRCCTTRLRCYTQVVTGETLYENINVVVTASF